MSAQKKAALASSWSDLPQEIISRIVRCLDSAIDVCRLHSVCKNWHYARNPDHKGLLCPFLPRIIANNNLPFTVRQHDAVILVARTVFLVKPLGNPPPSRGWLLTVEERVPGKLRILYPLSKDRVKHLPSNFPKFLDLSKYQISQVDKSYGLMYGSDKVDVRDVHQVILCSKSNVMVLYGGGTLIRLSLIKGHWRFVRYSIASPFSDVISYGRNNVRAIDSKGNVHVIDHKAARVVKTISPKSLLDRADRIMLLRSNEDLYIAACVWRDNSLSVSELIIYRLDEVKPELIDVSYYSYYRRVLFVSCDWRFFLYEYNLDLRHCLPKPKKPEKVKGDYVIYAEKSFPISYHFRNKILLYGTSSSLRIGAFFFDKDDEKYWVKEPHCTSATVAVLWPPPAWFWPDTCSSSSDDDEELDVQNHTPCNRKHLSSFRTVDASTSFVPPNKLVSEAKFTAVGSSNTQTIQDSKQNSSTVVFEGSTSSQISSQLYKKYGENMEQMSERNSDAQAREKTSTIKFQGVDIRSELLPTLRTIWAKHGNLFTKDTIRSKKMLSCVMEELAELIITLKNTTARTLTDSKVAEMKSTLSDIKRAGLKVDWLEPIIENSVAIQKSKPFIESIAAVDKKKAKIEEEEREFLSRTAKVKQELDEERACLSTRIPFPADQIIDLDDNLGDGL